jgi:hypothetical protein
MWTAAQAPFLQVVESLAPNVLLVLGKELATYLPKLPPGIVVCCIQHPSTGFDYDLWNPLFSKAVARARRSD